ncbi:MAG: amidase family protein [Alphaproteobacteria bacterium]
MGDYDKLDAIGMAEQVKAGKVTPLELVEEAIGRLEAVRETVSPVSNAYYDLARAQAKTPPPDGPLAGVPWLLKDLLLFYEGTETTNSMSFLAGVPADHDSEFIRRVKAGGLILVAKTKAPEYGYCISTEPKMFGPVRNPWNLERVAGGSSGGSAAAVAARVVPMAHASDGGGSIRIPACWNGLVGFKVSRGYSTYAPDYADFWIGAAVEGCVSLSVRDSAAYADLTAGPSIGDPYELPIEGQPWLQAIEKAQKQLRIGYTADNGGQIDVDPACRDGLAEAMKLCEAAGHVVEEMRYDYDREALGKGFALLSAGEAAAAVAAIEPLLGRAIGPDDFTRVNWQRIEAGRKVAATDFIIAVEQLRQIGRAIAQQSAAYDVVATPTMPTPAPPLGTFDMEAMDADPYNELLLRHVCFTLPYNISGQPAITVPLHWSNDGLPVGIQFAGRRGDDLKLLQLARQLEQAQPWWDKRAPNAIQA